MTVRTAVRYNREERSWQAINGETLDFGPGKAAKRQAMLTALQHDRPVLARIVGDLAAMNGNSDEVIDRLLKGAQLLVKGRVFKTWQENHYRVQSQTGSEMYEVADEGIPRAYSCDCQDYVNGQQRHAGLSSSGGAYVDFNPWPVCKHVLAVHLAWLSQWPLQDEPIPWDGR